MLVFIDVTKLYLEIDCFIKLSKLKKSLDYGTKYDRVIFILINATGQRLIYKNIFSRVVSACGGKVARELPMKQVLKSKKFRFLQSV